MNDKKRQELLQELELLKILFNFHAENWGKLNMNESETEEHINNILDRISEIKKILNEK